MTNLFLYKMYDLLIPHNLGSYNSEECDSDGGDCINCIVPYIMHVGDGWYVDIVSSVSIHLFEY